MFVVCDSAGLIPQQIVWQRSMAEITITILEGLERGRTFRKLETPVSIGREEDSTIQLNDERVSRIHAKIQEDDGRVLLTDTGSTNGTRLNGHPIQLRVLRPGDHIQIGRCILLYGSEAEIEKRAEELGVSLDPLTYVADAAERQDDAEFVLDPSLTVENLHMPLFPGDAPPELPRKLSPSARAELSDVLAFLHERIRQVTEDGREPEETSESDGIAVPWAQWQQLLRTFHHLAQYLRQVSQPDSE